MAWFKVDDTLHGHPKVRRAGAAAVGVSASHGRIVGTNRTAPRAGASTPGVPSGPRPRSDETGEDYHPW